MAGTNWIAGAIEKPGALREELGIKKGKTIPKGKLEKAAKSKGKLGKRARLAETLEGFNKAKRDVTPAGRRDAARRALKA